MGGTSERVSLDVMRAAAKKASEPLVRRSEVEAAFQKELDQVIAKILEGLEADIKRLWHPGRQEIRSTHELEFTDNVQARRMSGYFNRNSEAFRQTVSARLEGFYVSGVELDPPAPADLSGTSFTLMLYVLEK